MAVQTKKQILRAKRRDADKSIGDVLAEGGSVRSFGWGDAEVATMIHQLFIINGLRRSVDIFSSATTLNEAKSKAIQAFEYNNELIDSFAFARTGGNHWQLVHASRDHNGQVSTQVFNPLGDGACGYRAAAECMHRVSKKHQTDLGLGKLVAADGTKPEVEQQIEKVFKVIHPSTPAIVEVADPEPTPSKMKTANGGLPSASEMEAYKTAKNEMQRSTSTSAMLEGLNAQEKREAVIAAQQETLDYWNSIKAESSDLQTEHKESQEKQQQIADDEAYALELQAEFDAEQSEDSPRCGR